MKVSLTRINDQWRLAPWMVRHYRARKPIRRFFASREGAEFYARQLRESLRLGGNAAEFAEAQRVIAGTGHRLPDIVRAGLDFLRQSAAAAASPTATFSDGIALVLAEARDRRAKTTKGYEHMFRTLARHFGAKVAVGITNTDVQAYLDSLADRQGNRGRASPFTKKTVLVHIRMVLRALGIAQPLPRLKIRIPEAREIQFFSVQEIRAIFAASEAGERGLLALATFAAIRPLTIERLPADCVNVADQSIRIPAHLSKDHRAHCLETIPIGTDREIRPGPPAVLWEWLAKCPFNPRPWNPIQRHARQVLGGKWIQDGLRHSGATYYRAKYGDAATAELLTHTSIKMVHDHYAGLTTRAEAEEFFAMRPDSFPPQENAAARLRKKISWPADQALADLLQVQPAAHVATTLGCSDSMLSKHCKKRRIAKPGRGFWSRRNPF